MTAPFHLPNPSARELESLWLDWITIRQDEQRAFTAFRQALWAADQDVQRELLSLIGPAA